MCPRSVLRLRADYSAPLPKGYAVRTNLLPIKKQHFVGGEGKVDADGVGAAAGVCICQAFDGEGVAAGMDADESHGPDPCGGRWQIGVEHPIPIRARVGAFGPLRDRKVDPMHRDAIRIHHAALDHLHAGRFDHGQVRLREGLDEGQVHPAGDTLIVLHISPIAARRHAAQLQARALRHHAADGEQQPGVGAQVDVLCGGDGIHLEQRLGECKRIALRFVDDMTADDAVPQRKGGGRGERHLRGQFTDERAWFPRHLAADHALVIDRDEHRLPIAIGRGRVDLKVDQLLDRAAGDHVGHDRRVAGRDDLGADDLRGRGRERRSRRGRLRGERLGHNGAKLFRRLRFDGDGGELLLGIGRPLRLLRARC
jgi:hypothetical protein